MADTFVDVKKRAEKDIGFLAKLMVDPKRALREAKINLSDSADINRVELFVKMAQENLAAAGKLVGVKPGKASWGIGAGCCNGRLLMPRATPKPVNR
ncbi:MAG: hypothetical protein U0R49_11730 [Fimbriimonadales bacterium]